MDRALCRSAENSILIPREGVGRLSGLRLVLLVCAAQVLVQIGAYFWPALLPSMLPLWHLSNSEAGWITGVFYAAYMVAVPVLVTLTDRLDPRRVYLFGVGCTTVADRKSTRLNSSHGYISYSVF